ncbi:MAG: hypothetical protein ACXWQR_05375 [Ktedonobacterales bacterium]
MGQPTDQNSPPQAADSQVPNVPPAMERAEVLVDAFGVRLGQWTNTLGDGLRRLWARTCEEGEDIWAEAQDIRQRNHMGMGSTGGATGSSASGDESALH